MPNGEAVLDVGVPNTGAVFPNALLLEEALPNAIPVVADVAIDPKTLGLVDCPKLDVEVVV